MFVENCKNIIRNENPEIKLKVISNPEMMSFMMEDFLGFMKFMEKIEKNHTEHLNSIINILQNDKIAKEIVKDPNSAIERFNEIKKIAGEHASLVFNELSDNRKMIKDFVKDPDNFIGKLEEIKKKKGVEELKNLKKNI